MPSGEQPGTSGGGQVAFIVCRRLGIGGAERKIADICRYMSENSEFSDLAVYVVLDEGRPADPGESVLFDIVDGSPATILCKPQQKLGSFGLPLLLHLLWRVWTLRPAVIVAFLRGPAIISVMVRYLLWWRDIQVVISNDTIASRSLAHQVSGPFARWVIGSLVRICYPKAAVVIAPSETARHDLIDCFSVPETRILVNRNWVRPSRTPGNTRALFDLLYVGRVDRVKNLTFLVQILAKVRQVLPAVRACIVGSGDHMEDVSRLAEELGLGSAVALPGFQRDVHRYLAASKLFCLTSQYEGLPIAALEAMAHSLPVITTAYRGAEELVRDGETGHICASRQDYVASVVQLLTSEEQRLEMGKRAREYVRAHHGDDNLREFVRLCFDG